MAGPTSFKLSALAGRKQLPMLPGQQEDTTYGVVWDACPIPSGGSCYVVEFEPASLVTIIAYIDTRGCVYQVDRPITLAPTARPDFAAVPDENGHAGTVYVKDLIASGSREAARLLPRGRYRGSFRGTMREVRDAETWNTSRSLTYRPFMASMFLRYCVLDAPCAGRRVTGRACDGRIAREAFAPGASTSSQAAVAHTAGALQLAGAAEEPCEHAVSELTVDLAPRPLGRELRLFEGFEHMPLPDLLDAIVHRVDARAEPCGIERFARRVLAPIDRERVRALAAHERLNLVYIRNMQGFYINFDRSAVCPEDASLVMSVEAALNRVLQVLVHRGRKPVDGLAPAGASPSEEACSLIDRSVLRGLTERVAEAMDRAPARNAWARPGSCACKPGGEWDVRTRFVTLCERFNLVVRLAYEFQCDPAAGWLRVRFVVPDAAAMPQSYYDEGWGAWRRLDDAARAVLAREYAARMVLVLGAAAFASGFAVRRCAVTMANVGKDEGRSFEFSREAFMSTLMPLAAGLAGHALIESGAQDALAPFAVRGECRMVVPAERFAAPSDDPRPLPADVSALLMADDACELEVIEDEEDPAMQRFAALRARAERDRDGALNGLTELVDELEASCMAAELLSEGPVRTRFSENYIERILLPLLEEDKRVRFLRAPDALFFARHELCLLYLRAGLCEQALLQARALLDVAPTSMQAHIALVNVLAELGRFDDAAEVCRHGLRIAYDRESASYLLYRLAFALWQLGDREAGLACYRLLPPLEHMGDFVARETRSLMAEMGRTEPLERSEAVEVCERAGVPLAPTDDVTRRVADAAVLLADHGFFYLATRCVHHLWTMSGRDEFGVLQRSLARSA